MSESRVLLSGDAAVAEAALACGVKLGTGYPGTPSTEILEHFSQIGGAAQWAPNEKVAMEVATGVVFGGARAISTMKHVGLNVAADVLFTLAETDLDGGYVFVSADDPGMASSQNEQDNRNYASFAQCPMLEPSDSQEAYDFTIKAYEISERWKWPVMLRMTTRVCHSLTLVSKWKARETLEPKPFRRDFAARVMIPAHAKGAHVRLERKLAEAAVWNDLSGPNRISGDSKELGIICSGVAYQHVMEAAPEAKVLKLGMTWPLPMETIAKFAKSVKRCVVVEEGDDFLHDKIRAAGIAVERKASVFRFGELNVQRVRKLLAGDVSPDPKGKPGRPPQLCPGCPHRKVYEVLRDMGCIVPGDIGCYSLGTLPPFSSMDTLVCMGAGIGTGLGLRVSLPESEVKKVVSVIGDSTFAHSGLTGLVEMVYNRPPSGHVVLVLDNSTTAMTGLQEHPGTGRRLNMEPASKFSIEAVAKAIGVEEVDVIDPVADADGFKRLLAERLESGRTCVIVARRQCILQIRKLAKAAKCAASQAGA